MASSTVKVRVLACPNCGARLRWNAQAPVVECRYCHEHVQVDTGRKTQLPATVVSMPRVPRAAWIGGALALATAVTVVAYSMNADRRAASSVASERPTRTMAEIAATPLASTPQQVATRHGTRMHPTTVSVMIKDGPFSEVAFSWDKDRPEHIRWINLRPRSDTADLAGVIARARAQLGRRLRSASTGGFQFNTKGVSFNLSSALTVGAANVDDPAWRERLGALWTVTKAAALGTADQIDDRARRDLLNLSYSLTDLTQIGFDVVIDDATREVQRVMPGASSKAEIHEIGIEHPWIETARVRWNNEAGGKLWGVILHYPVELDFKAQADAIAACLAPVLGEPKKYVNDHLAGTFTLQYTARGGLPSVDLTTQTIQIYTRASAKDPVTGAGFHSVLTTLAACGK